MILEKEIWYSQTYMIEIYLGCILKIKICINKWNFILYLYWEWKWDHHFDWILKKVFEVYILILISSYFHFDDGFNTIYHYMMNLIEFMIFILSDETVFHSNFNHSFEGLFDWAPSMHYFS